MRDPANLPILLQSSFTTRLMTQRKVSPHTIASYRDTFRLLLQFAQKRLRKAPSELGLDDLDASLIGAFLEDLEKRRHNGARSRNLRLTAIRSFFRYASLETPAQSGIIQRVLAIPNQRQRRALVGFLTRPEIEAPLAAPNRTKWLRRRDHAFLLTAVQTGPAIVGNDRVAARGCLARSRRPRAVPGKRSKGTLHSPGQTHGRSLESLDSGAWQRRVQSAISQHPRWTFKCRWRSALARTPCGAGAEELRFSAKETSLAPCPAARRCDGVAAGRRGSSGDCALARP